MSPTRRCKNQYTMMAPLSQADFHTALRSQVRAAVRSLLETVMEEELAALLQAQAYERSPRRTGRRNGRCTRDLVTPAGVLSDLQVPRDREGHFRTQGFDRFVRYQSEVVDSIVAMFFGGVSESQVGRVTAPLLGMAPSASTVSRLAHGLEGECEAWRQRPLQAHYRVAYADGVYFPITNPFCFRQASRPDLQGPGDLAGLRPFARIKAAHSPGSTPAPRRFPALACRRRASGSPGPDKESRSR